MKIKAKKIRIEFNNSSGDYWEASCGSGLEFDEAIRMITRAWEEHDASAEPLIKDEKIRKAVRAWAEAENCTSEMSLYYTLNRQEKYITFHNPQTGSELQLCDFDSPVFGEMREYTIAELCGEEEAPEPIEPTFIDLDERVKEKEKK